MIPALVRSAIWYVVTHCLRGEGEEENKLKSFSV